MDTEAGSSESAFVPDVLDIPNHGEGSHCSEQEDSDDEVECNLNLRPRNDPLSREQVAPPSESEEFDSRTQLSTMLTFCSCEKETCFAWTDDVLTKRIRPFTPTHTPGPHQTKQLPSAKAYFELFFTEDFIEKIVNWTNQNAAVKQAAHPENHKGLWHDVSVEEMKAFIGISIVIEKCYRGTYSDLWSSRFPLCQFSGVKEVFSRHRYLQVLRYLHFCNEQDAKPREHLDHDPLYKVRPLITHISKAFRQEYHLHRELSVDEGMIPHKGRLHFKQYCKDKPVKWGIKVFILADSHTGYNFAFDVYAGAEHYADEMPVGLSTRVVLLLCQGIADRGHHVYTDRFYTSPILLDLLLKMGTLGCGTVQANRRNYPAKDLDGEGVLNRGENSWLICTATGMVATKWIDKRPIYFLSSIHDSQGSNTSVMRRGSGGESLPVSCPPCVYAYNKYMGGVDLNDQQTRLDRSRRTYRWYLKIYRKCILWSVFNAHVIRRELGHGVEDLYSYTMTVAHQLVADYSARTRLAPSIAANENGRLSSSTHCPSFGGTGYNRCKVCSDRNQFRERTCPGQENPVRIHRSTVTCSSPACHGVFLCLTRTRNCWRDYHYLKEYWH